VCLLMTYHLLHPMICGERGISNRPDTYRINCIDLFMGYAKCLATRRYSTWNQLAAVSSFLGMLLAFLVAFVSPLDALSDVLFSAHMVQPKILMLVAAPLLVTSDFPLAFLWALRRPWAQSLGSRLNRSQTLSRIWRVINNPVFTWFLFTIALWVWHASTRWNISAF
jgi:cytochrome c oxidase assembly factor CtaG